MEPPLMIKIIIKWHKSCTTNFDKITKWKVSRKTISNVTYATTRIPLESKVKSICQTTTTNQIDFRGRQENVSNTTHLVGQSQMANSKNNDSQRCQCHIKHFIRVRGHGNIWNNCTHQQIQSTFDATTDTWIKYDQIWYQKKKQIIHAHIVWMPTTPQQIFQLIFGIMKVMNQIQPLLIMKIKMV